MLSIIGFLKIIMSKLKIMWIINFTYKKKYPSSTFKSLLPQSVLSQENLFIEKDVVLKNPNIKIGNHTYIGNNTFIDSCSRIGSFCSISSDVKIGMRNHPLDFVSTSPIFYSSYRAWLDKSSFDEKVIKSVEIEEDVLISANVVIVNGVKVGRGSVIGAGAIVTKDVPRYSIVGGVPAKVIRNRFPNSTIELLENSKWWNKEDNVLKKLTPFINIPEKFISELDKL